MKIADYIKRIKLYVIAEAVFLTIMALYLVFLSEKTTKFGFTYTVDVYKKLYSILWIVVVVKLLLFLWMKRQIIISDKIMLKKVIIYLLFVAALWFVYYMVYRSDKYEFLRFLGILSVGVVGTDYKKILKTHVIVVGLMIGSSILASLSGYILNYVVIRHGVIHSSWGTLCTTDYASNILFLCIAAWIAWRRLSFRFFLIIGLLSVLNSWFIARSYTSTITGICFVIAIICDGIDVGKKKKIISCVLSAAFPLFAGITFIIEYLYHKGTAIGIKIDQWTHGRFIWIDNGFKNYGIKLFGRPFEQIGNGGNTFETVGYNFIDSSYVLILLRYGIVLFATITLLWILMTRKAVKLRHWRLAFGLALIALHSFSEHHFPEVNYNILVVLPFSVLGMGWLVRDKEEKPLPYENKRLAAGTITGIFVTLLVLFAGPYLLSIFRTIFDVTAKNEINDKNKIVSVLFSGFIILIAIFIIALYRVLCALFNKVYEKKTRRKNIIIPTSAILLVVIIMFSGIVAGKSIIDAKDDPYIKSMDDEKSAIEAVQRGIKTSGGDFYANDLPYIYRKTYGGFSESYFQSDEMASRTNVTVLMEGDYESYTMFAMGFLYTVISDDHSLYTNDEEVIKELEAAGYHLTGYFLRKRIVDLEEEAERNGLSLTSDGAIIIEGSNKPLKYGPYYDLRSGNYTVAYDLALLDINEYSDDYKVCTLLVCVRWGTKVAELPVFRRDFDKDGKFHAEIKVNLSEVRGCEFKVYPNGDETILLNGVSCQKTPDIDTHNIYDKKGRVIRTEYYDLEGNPIDTTSGYHAVEYKYNSEGLVNFYWYYDTRNNPVIISSGYAGVSKNYDIRKRTVRDTYYDIDGSRLTFEKGYSAVAYGYDDNNNINEYMYYDANDKPVMLSSGYSIMRRTFDDKRRIISELYFDINDEPVLISGGYTNISYAYDASGREISRCYYGVDGKLVVADSGYAQRSRQLDEKEGKVLREDFYGTDGNRIVVNGKYAVAVYKYDMYGNQTDSYYYSETEEPVMYYGAYFHINKEYDKFHQVIRETIYDTDNNAIVRAEGYVIAEREYDAAGNISVYRYLDKNGYPIMRTDGYAEVIYTYNDKSQMIKAEYFDASGKPVVLPACYSVIEYAYDEAGNQTDMAFYDTIGNPVMNWGVYYKLHRDFNEDKQITREEYLDQSGQIMMRCDGFAAREYEYDSNGNTVEERHLDLEGKLAINTSNGYAIVRREYDSGKHITKEYYLGLNSEPVDCTNGYAIVENTYDDAGNLVSTVHYNAKGEVVE